MIVSLRVPRTDGYLRLKSEVAERARKEFDVVIERADVSSMIAGKLRRLRRLDGEKSDALKKRDARETSNDGMTIKKLKTRREISEVHRGDRP